MRGRTSCAVRARPQMIVPTAMTCAKPSRLFHDTRAPQIPATTTVPTAIMYRPSHEPQARAYGHWGRAAPSKTPRPTQDQTAAADIGARMGRMRESGRAPMVEARSDPYDLSKGRSFLMSESTTAASWLAGSLANLANSAPPHTSARAVVAPTDLYARRLPTKMCEISRPSPRSLPG